jgi:hypothetical protein
MKLFVVWLDGKTQEFGNAHWSIEDDKHGRPCIISVVGRGLDSAEAIHIPLDKVRLWGVDDLAGFAQAVIHELAVKDTQTEVASWPTPTQSDRLQLRDALARIRRLEGKMSRIAPGAFLPDYQNSDDTTGHSDDASG